MYRPRDAALNLCHPLSNGLKFSWIGRVPGSLGTDECLKIKGTLVGNTYNAFDAAIGNRCYVFDGTGDYITLSNSLPYLNSIQKNFKFTIFAKVKFASNTARQVIVGNSISNSEHGFFLMYENYGSGYGTKALRFRGLCGTSIGICDRVSMDNLITDSEWHRIAIRPYIDTYNKVTFYLDGVAYSSSASPTGESSNLSSSDCSRSLSIGAASGNTTLTMNGKIADVMIWDRILSENECMRLTSPSLGPMYDGLFLPWSSPLKNVLASYVLSAGSGNFSTSGYAFLQSSRLLSASSCEFILDCIAANFGITMLVDSGDFSLSLQDINVIKNIIINAQSGLFELSEQESNLLLSTILYGNDGTFNVLGSNVTLLKLLGIILDSGNFSVSGESVNMIKELILNVLDGKINISGQDAMLLSSKMLDSNTGQFNLSGHEIELSRHLIMIVQSGSFEFSGQYVSLLINFILHCDSESFNAVGSETTLTKLLNLLSDSGEICLLGQEIGLLKSIILSNVLNGTFYMDGIESDLTVSRRLITESCNISLVGQSIDLLKSLNLIAGTGTIFLNGQEITIIYTPIGNFRVFRGRIIGMIGSGSPKSRQIGGN